MVNGSSYGLLSAGYAGLALDGLLSRDYIQNSMVFRLSGFYGDVNDISQVVFQYGTSINEPSFPGLQMGAIPEANYALGSIVLVLPLLGWMMVRKPNPKIRIA